MHDCPSWTVVLLQAAMGQGSAMSKQVWPVGKSQKQHSKESKVAVAQAYGQ